MPKVLITDSTFDRLDIEEGILGPLGAVIDARQCRTESELLEAVSDADFVLTQFARLTARVIAGMPRVRLIVRYGIGVDNVDLEAARLRGIPVCNVPAYCIDEVADHTLALLLNATRRISANGSLVRQGGWGLAVPLDRMKTLRDLTVGIVGFGRIGRAVADRLHGFGCGVMAYDPDVSLPELESRGVVRGSLEEVLSRSDVVTLHCPGAPETRHLINRESIGRMKPGSILINVARGEVVDTEALVDAIREGRIAAAALDVAEEEPLPSDSPLRSVEGVIVTSHIASASAKAVRTLRESAAEAIARSLRGEAPVHVVNAVYR